MTRPITAPKRPTPRIRLYSGDYLTGGRGIAEYGDKVPNIGQAASAGTDSLVVTLPFAPTNGRTLVAGVVWSGTATVTTPAGWTAGPTNTAGTVKVAMFWRAVSAGGPQAVTFVLSAPVACNGVAVEAFGLATVSAVDKSASASGTGTVVSSGTTAAQGFNDNFSFALVGHAAGGASGLGANGRGSYGGGVNGDTLALLSMDTPSLELWIAALNTNASAGVTANANSSAAWAGAVMTLKAAPVTSEKFAPVGEVELGVGNATARAHDLGDMTLTVPETDPAYYLLKPNTIVEVMVPDATPWAFEYYLVLRIENDHSVPTRCTVTVQCRDLRVLIANRVLDEAVLASITPGSRSAENWVRAYINAAAIAGGTGFPSRDPSEGGSQSFTAVPGLTLEATGGDRGTVYATSPAKVGAQIGQTIIGLYHKDELAWRIVLKDPGTPTGSLEFQTYTGVTRTIGVGAAEAVFAVQWDTAKNLRRVQDALDAITTAVVKGSPTVADPSVRQEIGVADQSAINTWGFIKGEVDASNEQALTAAVAATYLAERLPRDYLMVEPTHTTRLSLGPVGGGNGTYGLFDTVTALSKAGVQYTERVTTVSMDFTGLSGGELEPTPSKRSLNVTLAPGESWWDALVRQWIAAGQLPQGLNLWLGDPLEEGPGGARSFEPAALRQYTWLPGLTAVSEELNFLDGVTAGGATAAKAAIADIFGKLNAALIPSLPAGQITSGVFDVGQIPSLPAGHITSGTFAVGQIPSLPAGQITSGAFAVDQIPSLPASQITSGAFGVDQIPSLPASQITSGTFGVGLIPDLDAEKIVSGILDVLRIPDLDAAKLTSGVLAALRIPDLDAAKVTTGVLDALRIPNLDAAKVTTGAFDAARIPSLPASQITSGTFDAARIPSLPVSILTGVTVASGDLNKTSVAAWAGGATANPEQTALSDGSTGSAPTVNTGSDQIDLAGLNSALSTVMSKANEAITLANNILSKLRSANIVAT